MAERERLNRRDDRDEDRGRRPSRDDGRERTSSRDREPSRDRERSSGRSSGGSRSGNKFRYAQRSTEDVRKRAEQTGGSFDSMLKQGVDTFKPKVGKNTVRFLPPTWENPKHYGYDIWVHSYVGADESTYLCLDKMNNEACPICEAWKEAKKDGDEEEAKALKPTQRVLCWILDRDADDDKPIIWNMSWSQDRDIAALCDTKRGTLYVDDPEEGYDITFQRKGTQLNTRYFGTQIDRESSPILTKQRAQDEVLDRITENPIPDLLKFYPPEHLEKVISGKSEPRDEDLDDDKRGRSRAGDADDYESDDRRGRGRGRDETDDHEEEDRGRARGRDRDEEEAPRERSRERVRDEREVRGKGRDRDEEEAPRGRGRDRDEEEAPRGRRDREDDERPASRGRSRDDEEDRPARGRGRDEEEEPRGRRGRDDTRDEPEPEEPPAEEDPEDVEDRPRGRGRSRR